MRRQGLTYKVFKTYSFSIILHPPTLTFPDPLCSNFLPHPMFSVTTLSGQYTDAFTSLSLISHTPTPIYKRLFKVMTITNLSSCAKKE